MTKNEIVKANNELTVAENVDFAIPTGFINTFDLSTNDGKMKVVNAINNSVPLKDFMDV